VKKPRVLLLDEPLSALDAKLREAMQMELVRLQKTVGITFVIVTHDQDEALSMADRIAVMEGGRVRQVASPAELYESPRSRFVADFIGKMNLFTGEVRGAGPDRHVRVDALGGVTLPVDGPAAATVDVALRPEKVCVGAVSGAAVAFDAVVETVAYHGSITHLVLRTASGTAVAAALTNASRGARAPRPGERLRIGIDPADLVVLPE